jgi:hypothetical protein
MQRLFAILDASRRIQWYSSEGFKTLLSTDLYRIGLFLATGLMPLDGLSSDFSNEEDLKKNLFRDGARMMAEISDLRAKREHAERAWSEEKVYLMGLAETLRNREADLSSKVSELGELVKRQEAAWDDLKAEEQLASELEPLIASAVEDWLRLLSALVEQASVELGNSLKLELKAVELRATSSQSSIHRDVRSLVDVLRKLVDFQQSITPLIEEWDLADGSRGAVRVIYLGLGLALYEVVSTKEAGWYAYEEGDWIRKPFSSGKSPFMDYWQALAEGDIAGVFTFPMEVERK